MLLADLPEEVRAHAARAESDVSEARRNELKRLVDDTLLDLEAARRKISLHDLWEAEVLHKTPAVSEADARAFFEDARGWLGQASFESVRASMTSLAQAKKREAREAEFVRELSAQFPVAMKASASAEGEPDQVLATAGDVRITRASARWRLDAAAFVARSDLWREQYAAADKLANERLRKADAVRRSDPAAILKPVDRAEEQRLREGHQVKILIAPPAPPAVVLDLEGAASRGRDDAAVTVVEFGDFQCPPCGRLWKIVEEALQPYGDKVRYVFHNSPLAFHENAQKAAEAAKAAQAQGRFFEYAELLYRNQRSLDLASLKRYAAGLRLDTSRFSRELDGGRYTADVLLERRLAERVAARGTPTFFVNGVLLSWESYSVEGFRAAIDAAFARAGAK